MYVHLLACRVCRSRSANTQLIKTCPHPHEPTPDPPVWHKYKIRSQRRAGEAVIAAYDEAHASAETEAVDLPTPIDDIPGRQQ